MYVYILNRRSRGGDAFQFLEPRATVLYSFLHAAHIIPRSFLFRCMHAPCVPDDYIIHIHQNTNTPPRATRPKVGLAGNKVSETPINLQIRLRQHVARHGLIYMHNRRNELDMDLFIMYIAYIGTMGFTHDKE